ncbi:MAG: hypothetical protein NTX72_02960 [Candidatus Uhrbacteria bacterium]|nr:hypothetical protein [Candidatus Uhrbacteria bacterium]
MNTYSKEQLEQLFEQTGTMNIPECDEHRYALRRKLLNSSYFNEHRNAMRRRAMLFVPVVASGFAVAVLFVGTHTMPALNVDVATEQTEIAGAPDPDFLTDGLTATYFDARPVVAATLDANTVPFSTAAMNMQIN